MGEPKTPTVSKTRDRRVKRGDPWASWREVQHIWGAWRHLVSWKWLNRRTRRGQIWDLSVLVEHVDDFYNVLLQSIFDQTFYSSSR